MQPWNVHGIATWFLDASPASALRCAVASASHSASAGGNAWVQEPPGEDAILDSSLRASLGTPDTFQQKKVHGRWSWRLPDFPNDIRLYSPDPSVVQLHWNRMASKFSDLAFCFQNWIAITLQTDSIWQTIWGLLVAVSQSKIADAPLAPTNLARQRFTAAFAWDLGILACLNQRDLHGDSGIPPKSAQTTNSKHQSQP